MLVVARLPYRSGMRFPDSTFAALRLPGEGADESFRWGRLLLLAIALTIVAASAGLLAGG
jgi:hypothetical protein